MNHDSLNLTASHTLREMAQAETEAGAMHAKQIATMIAEDAHLDGSEVGKPTAGVDHAAAAADMLAAWNEWFNDFGGDKEKADRLARAACFAYEAVRQDDDPDTAPQALMCAFLQAMVDPLHEDLDYLRADPKSGARARAKIAAAQIGGAA